jgi:hypothetical protein
MEVVACIWVAVFLGWMFAMTRIARHRRRMQQHIVELRDTYQRGDRHNYALAMLAVMREERIVPIGLITRGRLRYLLDRTDSRFEKREQEHQAEMN